MVPSPINLKRMLARVLVNQPHLAETLDYIWSQAQQSFPGRWLEQWIEGCSELARSSCGSDCTLAYVRNAPICAALVGAEAGLLLMGATTRVSMLAGNQAALALVTAAPKAARRVATLTSFREWLRVVEQLASLAPSAVVVLLDRTEADLAEIDVRAYEAWMLGGVRGAASNPEYLSRFLRLQNPRATRQSTHTAGTSVFADVERRCRAYLTALWRLQCPIRSGAATVQESPRRTGFESGIIRVPETFPGFPPAQIADLFLASLAHVGAHLRFTRTKFAVGSLKPMQIALVSLIEDARVEHLAIRSFPGLQRLWSAFHVAEPSGALTAPTLFARLARALIDPDYGDDNAWVQKGRRMFFEQQAQWDDQAVSRAIGGLLGNDLGQMRVQFNARTYIVEPPYRDDNLGIWDFEPPPHTEAQAIPEAVRLEYEEDRERAERDREGPENEPPAEPFDRMARASEPDAQGGIPVAQYPEWDYVIGLGRQDWTTVVEFPPPLGTTGAIELILEEHSALVNRITALIRSAKVSRPVRLRRQPEGERLDLDACIGAAVARRCGDVPDSRVYMTLERRYRDLSALVLLDVSQSTNDIVHGRSLSVLALERAAAALLAHAMDGLGDSFAIHAFCSNGRNEVRYYRAKDFAEPFDGPAKRRLAGLHGGFSTRIGTAIRHAGVELCRQRSHRRLLLVVTDGEPSDIDVGDRKYLVEDARKAVASLAHEGVDVFCIGLDAGGDVYLTKIFGRRNVMQIDRLEKLPEKLPLLYMRLTS